MVPISHVRMLEAALTLSNFIATARPILQDSGPIAGGSIDTAQGGNYVLGQACAAARGASGGGGGGALSLPAVLVLLGGCAIARRRRRPEQALFA